MGAGASAQEMAKESQPLSKQRVQDLAGDRFDEKKWEEAPKDNEGRISTETWLVMLQSSGYIVAGWPKSPLGYERLDSKMDEGKIDRLQL